MGQKRIPRQNSHRIAKHLVVGGFAAAEVVIVHGGKIIMDQGIGVDHLDGIGRITRRLRAASRRFSGCIDKNRPQALASGHK
ncbi:hypothetical protein D3C75_907620 [compost metagenome]